VRKGDIILHGYNGCIYAISIACDKCFDCDQPAELTVENEWETKGRMINCDYTCLVVPIRTDDYLDEIVRLSLSKYGAFNKYGKGNMGYLFYINRKLAMIFIRAACKENPYLIAIDYLNELFLEDKND